MRMFSLLVPIMLFLERMKDFDVIYLLKIVIYVYACLVWTMSCMS
jgi:hypothetical protein